MQEIDFLALITDKVNKANIVGDSTNVYIRETIETGESVVTLKMSFYRRDVVFECIGIYYPYHHQLTDVFKRPGYHHKDLVEMEEDLYDREYDVNSKLGHSCLGGYLDFSDLLTVSGLCGDEDSLSMLSILTNCAAAELEYAKNGKKLSDGDALMMSFDGIRYHPLKMTVIEGDNTTRYIADTIEETNFSGTLTIINLDDRKMWFPVKGTFAYNVAMKWMADLVYPYAKYRVALLERSFDPDVVVTKGDDRVTTRYGYCIPTDNDLYKYIRLNEDGEFMAIEDVVKKVYSFCAENNLHVKKVRLTAPDEDDVDLYRTITYELE